MKRDGKRSGGCLWATVVCLLLSPPLFYLLSIGPALLLMESGSLPGPAFGRFYYPITWLTDRSQWFDAAMGWYLGLWT
jgi:hypothetical protein